MKEDVTVTKAARVKRFGLDCMFKTMQSDLGGVLRLTTSPPRPSDEF